MRLKGYTVRILDLYFGPLSYSSLDRSFTLAYSFLDPHKEGKLLAAYIVGIAVGQCIIFSIITGCIYIREYLTKHKKDVDQQQRY